MESESQLGPARYRAYLIIGVLTAVALAIAGVWGIVGSNEPVLGWIMLVAGIAITVLSIVQLRRS